MSLILLNSVRKVLAEKYPTTPVRIEEVSQDFKRPCFFITEVTENTAIKSNNVYQEDPLYQIVYFGERDLANQVGAISLYEVKDELKALFLLQLALPVIKQNGNTEKQRYAKIESFSSDLRLEEGAIYSRLTLNFTDDVPKTNNYDLIEDVDIVTSVGSQKEE